MSDGIRIVREHALRRFKERANLTGPDAFLTDLLLRMANEGREVRLKERFRLVALINNDFRDARYIKSGPYILVIEGGEIVTIHDGAADRWEYPCGGSPRRETSTPVQRE